MTKTIYLDESGYTGHNYLDLTQPIFAIASTDIDSVNAEKVLKKAFPRYKGTEFKLNNIWNSSNQIGLNELFRLSGNLEYTIFGYFIDKQFLVLIQMLEWLIEPHQTSAGFDFYADGYNRKLANYLHYGLTKIEQVNLLPKLVQDYQTFSRKPSDKSLSLLQANLLKYSEMITSPTIKTIVKDMALGCELLPKYTNLEKFKTTNELHLTTNLAIVSWWRQNFSEDFQIVHDSSSNFARDQKIWNDITNSHVRPFKQPLGDGSFVEYPLRVIATLSVDSKDNYSIQLCDIVAGIMTKYLDKGVDGKQRAFLNNLMTSELRNINTNGIRPEMDFPKGPPKRKNGPDAVDQIAKLIKG